ncbi:MAG TPA: ATP-binding cassette domain-containing protein [Acidimicrobiales bacterium]|nr:ATP-binding cassette domain-containing protein [Acidimicrobiales bacterium]
MSTTTSEPREARDPAGAAAGGGSRSPGRLRGPLRPGELAEAAVLGDIALIFEVLGWFLPLVGYALQVLAIVPIAMLASRHRARAAVVATIAVAAAGFVIGGLGLVVQTWLYGSIGLSVGLARRRGPGAWRAALLATETTGIPAAILADAASAALPSLRKLLLAQVNIYGRGIARVLAFAQLKPEGAWIVRKLTWVNDHWWVSYPVFELAAIALVAGLSGRYLGPLLDRLERDGVPPRRASLIAEGPGVAAGADREVAPVPVRLQNVSYRYPTASTDALHDVTLDIAAGGLTAVVGANGSGKSTVARVLAGLPPTSGEVIRAGDPGLGLPQGAAMIFQRPESQVLGVRVRDDLVWGLPASHPCDIESLLGRVGMAGMADRETSTMSGGELQRIAIAAALARAPQLIISDESTAMLDTEGRRDVVALLASLADSGVSVVHITHRPAEVEGARQIIGLREGVRVDPALAADAGEPDDVGDPEDPGPARESRGDHELPGGEKGNEPRVGRVAERERDSADRDGGEIPDHGPDGASPGDEMEGETGEEFPDEPPAPVALRNAGHVYADGTPWAHRALIGIDLDIEPGEGVVVTGPNGSGKSTLAWVLAGLFSPSEGEALLGGRRISERIGEVGIGFQHARLQLLRPTVLSDVAYGTTSEVAREALASVGIDPDAMGHRRVDALSGGEQRRVALAGILARRPVLVVLDEPLAGLDAATQAVLQRVLVTLRSERGVATIVVSHDQDAAAALGERLLVLERGRLVHDGRAAGR